MTVHADILKELLIAGYEGAHLHAAFERLCATLELHGFTVAASRQQSAAANPAPQVSPRAKTAATKPGDRRQGEFKYPIDGGLSKSPPMTAAERQAKRRANLKNVTIVTRHDAQAIDFIDESRNVTKNRDSIRQPTEFVGVSFKSACDSDVTVGKKEFPPHPPKKKHNPLYPQRDRRDVLVSVAWGDPLMEAVFEVTGKRFKRFSETLSFAQADVERAMALMAERSTAPPFKAVG